MITQLQGQELDATVCNPVPQTYEAQLVPRIFRPWAERLVKAANLMTGERVLDIACGTGIVARTAAPGVGPGGTVVGLDINPAMLEVAREVAAARRLPIEYIEDNAHTLPLPDASFDVAFCQHGLQFFADRPAAMKEAHRVLTPRGRAVFAVWRGLEHHAAIDTLDRVLAHHLDADVLESSDAPFWLGSIEEVRALFRGAGFGKVHIRTSADEVRFSSLESTLDALCGAHAPLAGAIAELSDDARAALYKDVAMAFESYRDDDGVMFTMTGALVLARK